MKPADQANKPLCLAPSTAVLIDTDKGVRPCCSYEGQHVPASFGLARLREGGPTVREIMQGPVWRGIQDQLARGEVPDGCGGCLQREADTGFRLRDCYDDPDWQRGITYLEVNSSNLCTLQCRHCGEHSSHRWAQAFGTDVYKPDAGLLLRSLEELDLSRLRRVMFKGGEPMVNSDVTAVLAHLESIGRLAHTEVSMISNGSVVRPAMIEWLRKAKSVAINMSLDGFGEVQTYIRHGDSSNESIERFLTAFSQIPGIRFGALPSVMAYNAFSLEQITRWWRDLAARMPAIFEPITFYNFVLDPADLSVSCLPDATRHRLADHYERLDPELYANVVRTLRLPFAGVETHDSFVRKTIETDRLLGRSVHDVIPELRDEMQLLDPAAELARIATLRAADELDAAATALDVMADCSPKTTATAIERGRVCIAKGDAEAALAACAAAAERLAAAPDAEAAAAIAALRVESLSLGDHAAAAREVPGLLLQAPHDPGAHLAAGKVRLRAGQPDEAITLVRRARELQTGASPLTTAQTVAAWRLELAALRAAERLEELQQRERQLHQVVTEQVASARAMFTQRRCPQALAELDHALALLGDAPDPAVARPIWDLLTQVHIDMGEFRRALAVIDRALVHAPADSDALVRRGLILAHIGRGKEASALATDLQDRSPGHAVELRRVLAEIVTV